jgi:competence protein ComEA
VPEPPSADRDTGPSFPPTWRERLDLLGAGPSINPGRVAAAAAAAAVLVVMVILVLRGPPPQPELSLPFAGGAGDPGATSTTTTIPAGWVLVHAAGAVHSPGVYRLEADARVVDLVDAAGGPLAEAELDRLNLAATVADGQQIYVPRVGEAVPEVVASTDEDGGAGTGDSLVDVNTATADELDTLPGVGPATAKAILDTREQRGSFSSVEELLDVPGIGEAKLDAMRDLVRV